MTFMEKLKTLDPPLGHGREVFFSGGPMHGQIKIYPVTGFRWTIMVTSTPYIDIPVPSFMLPVMSVRLRTFSYIVAKIVRRGQAEYVAEYQGDGGLSLEDLMDA